MFIPTVDAGLVLQAAATKTADFDGAWLDLGTGYAPGGLGVPAGAVINTTAFDYTTKDETYAFKLQGADPDASGAADSATIRDLGASVAVTATGLAVAKGLIDSRFVRLSLDVGGTTPSITYSADLGL